jgi:hypothetical protein
MNLEKICVNISDADFGDELRKQYLTREDRGNKYC